MLIMIVIGILLAIVGLEMLILNVVYNYYKTTNSIYTLKDESGFVEYRKVVPKKAQLYKGSIFIFPPTGGENIVDRYYARHLARHGFEVFILRNWTGYDFEGIDYELHNKFYGAAQTALNKSINLASSQNIGILGTSVGALHASIALTLNSKIKTGFLIVGGLTIPEVIIQSYQPAMTDLKKARYKKYQLKDDTQYLKELSENFKLEPTRQTVNMAIGKKVGSIISLNDKLVPTSNQIKLNEFFKANPVFKSSLSHSYTVAWYGLFNRGKVIHFFNENM